MKKFLGAIILGGLSLMVGGCYLSAEAATRPVKIVGEEVLYLLHQKFPELELGQTLFVTTGEYVLYTVDSYINIYRQLSNLPPCRFKASLVILGELHQHLHPLVAAGVALGVPGKSPAWFVVFITKDRIVYGLDPITGEYWFLTSQQVALLII